MRAAVTKLNNLRRQLGAWNAALYLLSRVLETASYGHVRLIKYYIVAQPITQGTALRPDPKTTLAFTREGDPLTQHFPRPRSVIARRYADGAQCITATVNGQFAGFLWWQHDRYEEDEVRCTYVLEQPQRCVWDYDVYVEPQFRFGRTLARLWEAANDHLAGHGVQWSYSRISAFNAASLQTHARLGMRACRSATFWLLGPLQIGCQSSAPFLHVSLSERQRPQMRLPAHAPGLP